MDEHKSVIHNCWTVFYVEQKLYRSNVKEISSFFFANRPNSGGWKKIMGRTSGGIWNNTRKKKTKKIPIYDVPENKKKRKKEYTKFSFSYEFSLTAFKLCVCFDSFFFYFLASFSLGSSFISLFFCFYITQQFNRKWKSSKNGKNKGHRDKRTRKNNIVEYTWKCHQLLFLWLYRDSDRKNTMRHCDETCH